jgi:uncharacterized protein (DUF2132 family)
MPDHSTKDPLHGITLEMILTRPVEQYGRDETGNAIKIKCFNKDPSITSSPHFLSAPPMWEQKFRHSI